MSVPRTYYLPPELLSKIFRFCTIPESTFETKDAPWSLGQVSSHWRQVAIHAPKIWTLIYINLEWLERRTNIGTASLLQLALKRSARELLDIHIVYPYNLLEIRRESYSFLPMLQELTIEKFVTDNPPSCNQLLGRDLPPITIPGPIAELTVHADFTGDSTDIQVQASPVSDATFSGLIRSIGFSLLNTMQYLRSPNEVDASGPGATEQICVASFFESFEEQLRNLALVVAGSIFKLEGSRSELADIRKDLCEIKETWTPKLGQEELKVSERAARVLASLDNIVGLSKAEL